MVNLLFFKMLIIFLHSVIGALWRDPWLGDILCVPGTCISKVFLYNIPQESAFLEPTFWCCLWSASQPSWWLLAFLLSVSCPLQVAYLLLQHLQFVLSAEQSSTSRQSSLKYQMHSIGRRVISALPTCPAFSQLLMLRFERNFVQITINRHTTMPENFIYLEQSFFELFTFEHPATLYWRTL